MNWGYSIILSFVLFILLIVTLVTISMRQDVNLVAEDYYKQEIEYQDQIERIRRTESLEQVPEIRVEHESGRISIDLRQESAGNGKVHFFRPSDASKDKVVSLTASEGNFISVQGWEKGLWKLKLTWSAEGEEYYMEKIITL